jgi:hypothetical protein
MRGLRPSILFPLLMRGRPRDPDTTQVIGLAFVPAGDRLATVAKVEHVGQIGRLRIVRHA